MKKNFALFLAFAFISLTSFSAFADVLDVCALSKKPLPDGLVISQGEKANYFSKLQQECGLQKLTQMLNEEMISSHGLTLENITIYQALRYVQRAYYDNAKAANVPLKVLYQRNPSDYQRPIEGRSTEIWDNWVIGMRQMPDLVEKMRSGRVIEPQDLAHAHSGFFTQGDEIGQYAHNPNRGKIKGPGDGTVLWYKLAPDEKVPELRALVDSINKRYAELRLLPAPLASGEANQHLPIRVRQHSADMAYYFYSAADDMVASHMKNIFDFLNSQIAQALKGQHMIHLGQPLTPVETIYLIQQFLVHVHPFVDGNGRTSRFLQDALFSLFKLPYGASGDLMAIDMMIRAEDLYRFALARTTAQMEVVTSCVKRIYPELTKQRKKLREADPQMIPYDCRLIYDESPRI